MSAAHQRIRIRNYVLGRTLGVGSFGKVKLAEHLLTNQLTAIKIVNRQRIDSMGVQEKINREVRILQKVVHPHIIRLYDVIETPTDIFLVMEYASGGELFDYIVSNGRPPEEEARRFFQQIVCGVAYCHSKGIAHRDLKPENLLLTADGNIKVADFGLSNIIRDGHFLRTSCGSPNYAAPEVISGYLYAGPEIDVWSCGVILYALLCGALPFDDEAIPKLFKKIKNGIFVLPSQLQKDASDLIVKLLTVEPLRRITMNEVRSHPWFKERLPKYLSCEIEEQGYEYDRFTSENDLDSEVIDNLSRRVNIPYVKKCGRTGVVKAVLCNKTNELKTMYSILHDRKQKVLRDLEERSLADQSDIGSTGASAMSVGRKSMSYNPYSGNSNSDDSASNKDGGTVLEVRRGAEAMSTENMSSSNGSGSETVSKANFNLLSMSPFTTEIKKLDPSKKSANLKYHNSRRRKWYFGIQSKRRAHQVMFEVFKVLRNVKIEWNYSNEKPFRVNCRWRHETGSSWIYIRMQLYEVHNSIYLLDFHNCTPGGETLEFLELCRLIISKLKPPPSKSGSLRRMHVSSSR